MHRHCNNRRSAIVMVVACFIVLDPWNGGDPNWYFFVIRTVRTAVTGSFIESPLDLYGWLSFHDLSMPKNWKVCILFSVDWNSTLTPAASEFAIFFMTKIFATVASLVNLVSDGKKVVSLYGAAFLKNIFTKKEGWTVLNRPFLLVL